MVSSPTWDCSCASSRTSWTANPCAETVDGSPLVRARIPQSRYRPGQRRAGHDRPARRAVRISSRRTLRNGLIPLVPALLLVPALSGVEPTGPLFPNPVIGIDPGGVAVGDFNGDGKPDLAVSGYSTGDVAIELGRGDGTFEAGQRAPVGFNPIPLVVADFNRDGIQDLAVLNEGNGYPSSQHDISILLGNRDGTFLPEARLSAGQYPTDLTVADFN